MIVVEKLNIEINVNATTKLAMFCGNRWVKWRAVFANRFRSNKILTTRKLVVLIALLDLNNIFLV
jgi:hypothetical protein